MKVTALQVTAISAFLPSIAYAGQDSSSIQTCCRELRAAGLHNVYLPSNPKYDKAVGSYWSLTSQLKPYCFVQPENAQEVALAVKTLVDKTFCKFAVRSGGHSSVTGFSNIEDGVTIDLARLNSTTYDAESCTASLRPGARWLGVYETLDKIGVGVPGARLGLVGVGGSTLGGGLSYWLHEKGMVCDSVVRYQVVLANGDIIEASADQHQDLFKALKGGGGAFGIVTRFDMAAFNANPLWGGVFEYPESSTDDLIPALKHWTDNADNYPPGTAWTFWTYQSLLKKTSVFVGLVDTTGKADDPAFDEFQSVPGKISGELTTTNMSTLALGSRPDGYRDIWFSLTFKNEERILRKSLELHDKFVKEMKAEYPNADYQTQCMLQPFPAIVAKAGEGRGGNILGIERQKDNGMILLGTIAVRGVAQEKFARGKILAWKDAMEKYTKKVNGHIDYIYMNYADGSQNPLLSYGKENLETMRDVLSKYDPNGVFRKRVPGGFDLPE